MKHLISIVATCLLLSLAAACSSCPEGGGAGSLFCHGGSVGNAGDGDGTAECTGIEAACSGVCVDLGSDRDNCGDCGEVCGDGFFCSGGTCEEGCEPGLTECGSSCYDTEVDPDNCGGCGISCDADQVCSGGECGCPADQLECGGTCIDPSTDLLYCGATADCAGANVGVECDADAVCLDGTCVSTTIYVGSLPLTSGRWTYAGVVGISGANTQCALHWPGSAVCTSAKMIAAQNAGELINPISTNADGNPGAAVDASGWWLDDPADAILNRCVNTEAENIPWSYPTAHLGQTGKYVGFTPGVGTITALTGGGACSGTRFVSCCNIVVAP